MHVLGGLSLLLPITYRVVLYLRLDGMAYNRCTYLSWYLQKSSGILPSAVLAQYSEDNVVNEMTLQEQTLNDHRQVRLSFEL